MALVLYVYCNLFFQWLLRKPECASYMGSIGKDEFGETLEKKARAGGVNVCYQKQDEHPTGK